MNTREKYGYPLCCNKCTQLGDEPRRLSEIEPFHKDGSAIKLMLIGQDPTIIKDPERVNTVLMLNEISGRNGQLRKWLETELIGKGNFDSVGYTFASDFLRKSMTFTSVASSSRRSASSTDTQSVRCMR